MDGKTDGSDGKNEQILLRRKSKERRTKEVGEHTNERRKFRNSESSIKTLEQIMSKLSKVSN